MASLSIRRLEDDVVERLKARASRDAVSLEESVRRILRAAVADDEPVGVAIRRIVGDAGHDLVLPDREVVRPIDFTSEDYGDSR